MVSDDLTATIANLRLLMQRQHEYHQRFLASGDPQMAEDAENARLHLNHVAENAMPALLDALEECIGSESDVIGDNDPRAAAHFRANLERLRTMSPFYGAGEGA